MTAENHVYLRADEPLGERIAYYYDHLENARNAGHDCLSDWVRRLHTEKGGKASDVASAIGVTYGTVLKWFRNLCLPVRQRGGRDPMSHPRRREVGEIYRRTGSGIKTAEELGISVKLAYDWLRADNIPRTGKRRKK